MKIIPASNGLALSLWAAIDQVAKERKYLLMQEGPEKESLLSFVSNIVKNNWTQFYAVEGGRVIGWCNIVPKQKEGVRHVGPVGMGVISEFRGKGIGKRLMAKSIKDAFSKGIERIELEVFSSNTVAIKLYENFGFSVEGVKRKARFLENQYDDIVMMSVFNTGQNMEDEATLAKARVAL